MLIFWASPVGTSVRSIYAPLSHKKQIYTFLQEDKNLYTNTDETASGFIFKRHREAWIHSGILHVFVFNYKFLKYMNMYMYDCL